jgi:hypothetical protein
MSKPASHRRRGSKGTSKDHEARGAAPATAHSFRGDREPRPVALAGLGYNTWRNERTEENRNIRVASFEMLKTVGELQLIVDYAHFRKDQHMGDPTLGWGKVLFLRDLAQVVPEPVPEQTERLLSTWRDNWERIETDNGAVQRISGDIYNLRLRLLDTVHRLR